MGIGVRACGRHGRLDGGEGQSCGFGSCPGTGGPQVGRRQLSGGRRYVTSEGSEGAMVASVHEVSAGPLSYCCGGDGGMVNRSDRARALLTRRAVRGTDAACRRQAQGCRVTAVGSRPGRAQYLQRAPETVARSDLSMQGRLLRRAMIAGGRGNQVAARRLTDDEQQLSGW